MGYKTLFLWIPLVIGIAFISLFAIPRGICNPWEYVNIWDLVHAFSFGYLVLGVLSFSNEKDKATLLLAAGAIVWVFGAVCCWATFGSLHYVLNISNKPATASLIAVLCLSWCLSRMMKGKQATQINKETTA